VTVPKTDEEEETEGEGNRRKRAAEKRNERQREREEGRSDLCPDLPPDSPEQVRDDAKLKMDAPRTSRYLETANMPKSVTPLSKASESTLVKNIQVCRSRFISSSAESSRETSSQALLLFARPW